MSARARTSRMSLEVRMTLGRQAAIRRWIRARFGGPSFRALDLPGGGIVDAGLASLAAGEETIESLLVSQAAPRLRREGVPLSGNPFPDSDVRLYRLLERQGLELAHARYRAWLRQIESFADACSAARRGSPGSGDRRR